MAKAPRKRLPAGQQKAIFGPGKRRLKFARSVAVRVYYEFSEDRILTVAGGITFFALLALFPAIAATVSLYGIFSKPSEIARDLDLVSGFIPEGAVTVLRAELRRLIGQKPAVLDMSFAVSFLVALWSASGGYKALVEGLNIAYEVEETRGFFHQTLNAIMFTGGAILAVSAGIELGIVLPKTHDISGIEAVMLEILVWPSLFLGCALVLEFIYRFGPNRPKAPRRWVTWGSGVAAFFWVLGTQCFTWYAQNFGSFNRVYGNLGAVVGFLTWLWISLVILLLGAELNRELDRTRNKHD